GRPGDGGVAVAVVRQGDVARSEQRPHGLEALEHRIAGVESNRDAQNEGRARQAGKDELLLVLVQGRLVHFWIWRVDVVVHPVRPAEVFDRGDTGDDAVARIAIEDWMGRRGHAGKRAMLPTFSR